MYHKLNESTKKRKPATIHNIWCRLLHDFCPTSSQQIKEVEF